MAPKKKAATILYEFKIGDLVGARVRGHPSWPGKIEKIETNPKNNTKKYTVRFFVTEDISCSFTEFKPFSEWKESQLNTTNRGAKFAQAFELCREEYEQSLCGTKREKDERELEIKDVDQEVPMTIDGEEKLTIDEESKNNKSIARVATKTRDSRRKSIIKVKLDRKKETQRHLNEKAIEKAPRSRISRPDKQQKDDYSKKSTIEHEETKEDRPTNATEVGLDSSLAKTANPIQGRPNKTASSKSSLPKTHKLTKSKKAEQQQKNKTSATITKKQEILETTPDSSPNNDLMENNDLAESVYYDAEEKPLAIDQSKNNLSLSKSMIDHNSRLLIDEDKNSKNSTLEKLKKKIAIKLQEKEALKSNRLQKKKYERAATKFPQVFRRLDQVFALSEKLMSIQHGSAHRSIAATQLVNAHINLRTMLEKTLEELNTDYAKIQHDTRYEFRQKLVRIIGNLKEIRDGDKNTALQKTIRRLIKDNYLPIRVFINEGDDGVSQNDAINERKENDAIKME